MTELDQLRLIYKDYQQIYISEQKIEEYDIKKYEVEKPNYLSDKKAKKQNNIKLHLTKRLWYLVIYAISVFLFFYVVIPYLFPILIDNVAWFSDYTDIPNDGIAKTLYIIIFLLALVIPFIFSSSIMPEYGGITIFAIVIMSVLLLILSIAVYVILDLLQRAELIYDPSTEFLEFYEALNIYGINATLHLFIIGIYSSVISLVIYTQRYKVITSKSGSAKLLDIQKKNAEMEKLYNLEVEGYDLAIKEEKLKISRTRAKLKKQPFYEELNKEPAGFERIMMYFSQRRIANIEEANNLYRIEKENFKIYQKEEARIKNYLAKTFKEHKNILYRLNSNLDAVKDEFNSKNFSQAVALHKKEVLLDKIKYK